MHNTAQNSHQSGLLTRAFNYVKRKPHMIAAIAIGAAAGQMVPKEATAPVFDYFTAQTALKHAPLTAGESTLVHAVFGDDFNTAGIRKNYRSNSSDCGASHGDGIVVACVGPNEYIKFVDADTFMDDYSLDGSMSGRRTLTFMHEATHIWQYRTSAPSSGQCNTYALGEAEVMNSAKTFDDYCSEQQAQLVGAYAAYFLRPSGMGAMSILVRGPDYLDRIRQIVEKKFPRVIAARTEQMQKQRTHLACFKRATSEAAQDACAAISYTNLNGQNLTIRPEQVTFTLPNGQMRHPAVAAARRATAAKPAS